MLQGVQVMFLYYTILFFFLLHYFSLLVLFWSNIFILRLLCCFLFVRVLNFFGDIQFLNQKSHFLFTSTKQMNPRSLDHGTSRNK